MADVPPAGLPPVAEEAPDPRYRLDANGPVHRLIHACIDDAKRNQARKSRDRQDWHNHLLYRGDHWRVWDKGTERYVERGYDPERGGLPEYVPRCVTNLFALKIDGNAALLDQSDPSKEFAPASEDDADTAAAEVAEDALPVLFDEIGYRELKARANKLVCLMDKVALVPYYDNDIKHGTQIIQDLECPACHLVVPPDEALDGETVKPCPACAEQGIQSDLVPAMDAAGQPAGQDTPIGKLCCELVTSVEFSLPSSARCVNAKEIPWFLQHSRMAPSEIRRRWKDAPEDLSKRGGQRHELATHIADSIAQLSSPSRAQSVQFGTGDTKNDEPVVYRLQHDPITDTDADFPDGLYAVMIDDTLVEAGPLPVQDDRGKRVKSVVLRTYAHAPGTPFGKPKADDLGPLQEQRNILESLSLLIHMHEAAPTTYLPLSMRLETQPTGVPGEFVWYSTTVAGDKPTRVQGTGAPASLPAQIEAIDQKMEEISCLNAVLAGQKPEGDHTLGEIEVLQERGMAAFKEALDHQLQAEEQLCHLLLYIAKRSAWSPRFRQIRGENGEWEIKQFSATDLQGSVHVRLDPTSAWPKSPVAQQMRLKAAFEMGCFPPPAQDPELQMKVVKLLNLGDLKPSVDTDQQQIARKLGQWKQAHAPEEIAPPDPVCEDLRMHKFVLTNYLKSEPYELLKLNNPPLAAAQRGHVEMITQIMAMQQAQAMAAQNPQPPQKPEAPAPPPSPLDGAVQQGVLTPASAVPPPPGPPDMLGGAIQSGALMPAGAMPPPPPGPSVDDLLDARLLTPLNGAQIPGAP